MNMESTRAEGETRTPTSTFDKVPGIIRKAFKRELGNKGIANLEKLEIAGRFNTYMDPDSTYTSGDVIGKISKKVFDNFLHLRRSTHMQALLKSNAQITVNALTSAIRKELADQE